MSASEDETPTLSECPACVGCVVCKGRHVLMTDTSFRPCGACDRCTYCDGTHVVTPGRAAAYVREQKGEP